MDVGDSLYDKIRRVPPITKEEVMEMIHIRPVIRDSGCFYRECKWDNGDPDPFNVAFMWNAKPNGEPFAFGPLSAAHILVTTSGSYFCKVTLEEVYAWIRLSGSGHMAVVYSFSSR